MCPGSRGHVKNHRLAIVARPSKRNRVGTEQRFGTARRRYNREGRRHGHRHQPLMRHQFHFRPQRCKMMHVGQRQTGNALLFRQSTDFTCHHVQRQGRKAVVAIAANNARCSLFPCWPGGRVGLAVGEGFQIARHPQNPVAVTVIALCCAHGTGNGIGVCIITTGCFQCLDTHRAQVNQLDGFGFHDNAFFSMASTVAAALNNSVSWPCRRMIMIPAGASPRAVMGTEIAQLSRKLPRKVLRKHKKFSGP